MKNSYPILLLSYLGMHPLLLAASCAGLSIPSFLNSGNLLAVHVVAAVALLGLEDYLRPARIRTEALGAVTKCAGILEPKRSRAYGVRKPSQQKRNSRFAAL